MEEEGQQNPSRSPGRPGPMTDQRSDRYPQFLASFRSHGARGRERGGRERGLGGGFGQTEGKTSQRGRFWTAGNSEREEEVAGMKTEKVKRCSFFFLPPKKDPLSGSVLHFCSDFLFQWVTLHLMGFSLLQDLCVCPSYTPPNAFQCILKSKWQWKEKNRVGGACRHFRHVHDRGDDDG